MQGRIISGVTPQQKMVNVNNKFGNTNIKNQQGTTRVLYDTLPLDGRTLFRFFEECSTRQFPLTNLTSEGNRLEVGSTFTLEYVTLNFLRIINGEITNTSTTLNISGPAANPWEVFATGEIDFFIANSQVVKSLPSSVCAAVTNPTAVNDYDGAFSFSTDIVIPPLLEYVLQLKTTTYGAFVDPIYTHIQCNIFGTAGIIAPQTTF